MGRGGERRLMIDRSNIVAHVVFLITCSIEHLITASRADSLTTDGGELDIKKIRAGELFHCPASLE